MTASAGASSCLVNACGGEFAPDTRRHRRKITTSARQRVRQVTRSLAGKGASTGNTRNVAGVSAATLQAGGPPKMPITDYDTPRPSTAELAEDSIEELKVRRQATQSAAVDLDEPDTEDYELPGADLSDEELTVAVVPMRADEFRCDSCFLVHHRSQLVPTASGRQLCRDCA
jgi:hypothetical protein